MTVTTYARSVAEAPWFQPPDFHRPVVATEWEVIATAFVSRPTDDPNWHMTCVATATVDQDVSAELRLRTAPGNISAAARIVSYVGPVFFGWTQITDWATPEFVVPVFLEGRRLVGGGGGVRIHKAALTLVSAPNPSGVVYPAGYDPGEDATYPPDYLVDPYS